MDRVRQVRALILELNEQDVDQGSRPLHEILAENREKQDVEFQMRYQQRNVFHALDANDNQWLKKVKEKKQAQEAELEKQVAQGLKSRSKATHDPQTVTLPSGRVKKKKSSLIK